MEGDREKYTIEVPLANPADAQKGVVYIDLTPEEIDHMRQLADKPEELHQFIEDCRRKRL